MKPLQSGGWATPSVCITDCFEMRDAMKMQNTADAFVASAVFL